jgi:hypothetical protein
MTATSASSVEVRARQSRGTSKIMEMVCRTLERRHISDECLADVGCGTGNPHHRVRSHFSHYVGVHAVHYDDFPHEGSLI